MGYPIRGKRACSWDVPLHGGSVDFDCIYREVNVTLGIGISCNWVKITLNLRVQELLIHMVRYMPLTGKGHPSGL